MYGDRPSKDQQTHLDADGYTVERTDGLARDSLELIKSSGLLGKGLFEVDLGQAETSAWGLPTCQSLVSSRIDELLRDGSSMSESFDDLSRGELAIGNGLSQLCDGELCDLELSRCEPGFLEAEIRDVKCVIVWQVCVGDQPFRG